MELSICVEISSIVDLILALLRGVFIIMLTINNTLGGVHETTSLVLSAFKQSVSSVCSLRSAVMLCLKQDREAHLHNKKNYSHNLKRFHFVWESCVYGSEPRPTL